MLIPINGVIVQSLSHVWLFMTPWTAPQCSSIIIYQTMAICQDIPNLCLVIQRIIRCSHCQKKPKTKKCFKVSVLVSGSHYNKHHRLSRSLGGWKSEIRTPAGWGSGESSLPSEQWQHSLRSHMVKKKRGELLGVSSYCCSAPHSCPALCHHGPQHARASLSFTISWSLLKFMSIESVMLSNHLILCRPLLLLPSIPPSISVFSNESALLIRWPKYWNFSFSICPSYEYSGLISSVKTLTL